MFVTYLYCVCILHCLFNCRSNVSQSSTLSEFKFNHDAGYVTAIMDGVGKLCSKYGLLSGIVIAHIAIDRLSLFNAGLSDKSVIQLFNTLSSCIDKVGIGAMRVLCDVLSIYSSFGNCIESIILLVVHYQMDLIHMIFHYVFI